MKSKPYRTSQFDKEIKELQKADRSTCSFCAEIYCTWDGFRCEHCDKPGCDACYSDGCVECLQHVKLCHDCAEKAGWNYWEYECGDKYRIDCNSEHKHCKPCREAYPEQWD